MYMSELSHGVLTFLNLYKGSTIHFKYTDFENEIVETEDLTILKYKSFC